MIGISFSNLSRACRRGTVLTLITVLVVSVSSAPISQAEPPMIPIQWEWGPVMPHAQSAFATAATPAGVLVIGGTYWSSEGSPQPTKRWLSTVNLLAWPARIWQKLPDYPVPISDALIVSMGDDIYAIGGRNPHGPLNDVHILNAGPANGTWRRGPSLPNPLSRIHGGASGTMIYAFSDDFPAESNGRNASGAKLLALDTASLNPEWKKVAELPNPEIGYRSAAICEGRVYLFGGGIPGPAESIDLVRDAWAFDPPKSTWRKLRPLPLPMRDASTAVIAQRHILLAGGVEQVAPATATPDGHERIILSNRCWLYDTTLDQYAPATPLPLAVADHGLAVIGRTIIAIGGEDSIHRTRTDLVQIGTLPQEFTMPTQQSGELKKNRSPK
jgi:hypothetical protein